MPLRPRVDDQRALARCPTSRARSAGVHAHAAAGRAGNRARELHPSQARGPSTVKSRRRSAPRRPRRALPSISTAASSPASRTTRASTPASAASTFDPARRRPRRALQRRAQARSCSSSATVSGRAKQRAGPPMPTVVRRASGTSVLDAERRRDLGMSGHALGTLPSPTCSISPLRSKRGQGAIAPRGKRELCEVRRAGGDSNSASRSRMIAAARSTSPAPMSHHDVAGARASREPTRPRVVELRRPADPRTRPPLRECDRRRSCPSRPGRAARAPRRCR